MTPVQAEDLLITAQEVVAAFVDMDIAVPTPLKDALVELEILLEEIESEDEDE